VSCISEKSLLTHTSSFDRQGLTQQTLLLGLWCQRLCLLMSCFGSQIGFVYKHVQRWHSTM